MNRRSRWGALAGALCVVAAAAPGVGHACACGCGIFDVGTSAMFPTRSGGMVYLEQDFVDQNQNWSGTTGAPPPANTDRPIPTNFLPARLQSTFARPSNP